MAKYPLLKEFLQAEIKRVRADPTSSSARSGTISEIANDTALALATIHGYVSGKVIPDPDKTEQLASYFYRSDPEGRTKFLEKIAGLRNGGQQTILGRAGSGSATLKVGIIHYPPFCHDARSEVEGSTTPGSGQGFLDAIVRRFALLSGFVLEESGPELESDAVGVLTTGTLDVVVSLFQTYQRSRDIVTFTTPLRTSLNAVCIDTVDPCLDRRHLRRALDPSEIEKYRRTDQGSNEVSWLELLRHRYSDYQFVALRNEVGFSFLRDVVLLDEDQFTVMDSLQPEDWAEKMKAEGLFQCNRPVVALADEFLMLRLAAALGGSLVGRVSILWPLVTSETARDDRRRNSPLYQMGLLSVSRSQDEFVQFLRDGLRLLLKSDVEFLSDLFFILYQRVRTMVEHNLQRLDPYTRESLNPEVGDDRSSGRRAIVKSMTPQATAIRVARYTVGLEGAPSFDTGGTGDLPWDPILALAKMKLGPEEESVSEGFSGICPVVRPMELLFPVDSNSADWILGSPFGVCIKPIHHLFAEPRFTESAAGGFSQRASVLTGFFGTPRRAVNWHFLPSPLQIPLGCVSMALPEHLWASLQADFRSTLRDSLRVVVHDRGAAHEYLTDTLRLTDLDAILTLKAEDFTGSSTSRNGEDRRPKVVIVDVIHCLLILLASESKCPGKMLDVNWPEVQERSAKKRGKTTELDLGRHYTLPSFPLTTGVHVSSGKVEAIERVLRMQIDCDLTSIASQYATEVRRLEIELGQIMSRLAAFRDTKPEQLSQAWARRMCSVDDFSLETRLQSTNPWYPVCLLAKRMLD